MKSEHGSESTAVCLLASVFTEEAGWISSISAASQQAVKAKQTRCLHMGKLVVGKVAHQRHLYKQPELLMEKK